MCNFLFFFLPIQRNGLLPFGLLLASALEGAGLQGVSPSLHCGCTLYFWLKPRGLGGRVCGSAAVSVNQLGGEGSWNK